MAKYGAVIGAVMEILAQYPFAPTIRQVFYRLVSPPYQLISNTRSAYTAFDAQMVRARERGELQPGAFTDTSRQLLGGDEGFDSPGKFLDLVSQYLTPESYTRPLRESQPSLVEVWCEKDALSQLLLPIAEPYRVRVFPSRGYSPFTKLNEAVERFNGKPGIVLDLRDLNPSGVDMSRDIQERLARYGGVFQYYRLALNYDQVQRLALPPNPTKVADSRGSSYRAKYGDACWELDALPPDELQRLVGEAIRQNIDWAAWQTTEGEVEKERHFLLPVLERARAILKGGGV